MTENAPERPVPSRQELSLCAHDLRGSLTVIAGYTGLIRRGLDPAELAAALDGIDAAIGRIDRLIGETLSGRALPRQAPGRLDLSALAEQAAADARAAFGREIIVNAPAGVCAEGDEVALARALENLLSNAAKYAPEGPIEVHVTRDGDRAVLDVIDRGPGIPEAERSAVFEPFHRLADDPISPGTGLGLAVVRSVAERMAGTAEMLERAGGGTVARITLPACD